jgi:alcohol dehydrogenase
VASVADNVPDGYRAVAGPLAQWPGEEVLVVGGFARSVGLYALALGASRVVYADTDSGRLDRRGRHADP